MIPFSLSHVGQAVTSHSKTLVMGVINTTPDSFSDGGVHFDPDVAIAAGLKMLEQGADILDVGGESTRPGSASVDVTEELKRVIPVIEAIAQTRPEAMISVDTRRRSIAEAAIRVGARIINDVSGFRDDPRMVDVAREAETGLVVMHMLGKPKTMQIEINYDSFPGDIYEFFRERIQTLEDAGISPENIIVDPGIGFGKTFDQNLILLNRLDSFKKLGKAILVGPSRKSFLGKILDEPKAAARDTGTLAAVTAAVLRGASIIRVHNVPPAVQACKVADAILRERVAS
ncbi:MAG: dihydropteroate synthase [Deltaproteobacteria bacterium]|nr:dihydropteroate synthase [Deltaproteobacteria bacterium]